MKRPFFFPLFRLRFFVSIIALLFFSAFLVAFLLPSFFSFFDAYITDLLASTEDLGGVALFWFIVRNNITVSLIAFLGGLFFGILPVFFALSNGAIVGYVLHLASVEEGLRSWWYLLPHGIFELPAVFLSLALGLHLGVQMVHLFGAFFYGKDIRRQGTRVVSSLSSGLFLFGVFVLPLLIIAGIIETLLIIW
jgi:stage II sporulation protein M